MEPQANSTSASPDPKAFLGIDPNDTDEVKIQDAVFTCRVIPSGLWDILTAAEIKLGIDANREAIQRLAAQGRDPLEKAFPEDPESPLTILDIEQNSDQQILLKRAAQQLEVIRFGLKSHTNFVTKRGEVKFETEQVEIGGFKFDAVKKDVLAYYAVNKMLRESVYLCILRLNSLGDSSKKA